MTATLEGSECSAARSGRTLPPGKIRYPFYRRLGRPPGRSGRAENLVPTGIRYRTVQPVVIGISYYINLEWLLAALGNSCSVVILFICLLRIKNNLLEDSCR